MSEVPSEAPKSKLYRWRNAHGLTQRNVSELTGYDETFISRLETGDRTLRPVAMARFARRLGVEISDVFDLQPSEAAG